MNTPPPSRVKHRAHKAVGTPMRGLKYVAALAMTIAACGGGALASNTPDAQKSAPVEPKVGTIFSSPVTEDHFRDIVAVSAEAPPELPPSLETPAEYTLDGFLSAGVVNWGGYKFTYYSERVLPGGGLAIPGRHVSEAGYVSDEDGYIVLAGSAPHGTVYETPFGFPGKIYDRGTSGNHLDVYVR